MESSPSNPNLGEQVAECSFAGQQEAEAKTPNGHSAQQTKQQPTYLVPRPFHQFGISCTPRLNSNVCIPFWSLVISALYPFDIVTGPDCFLTVSWLRIVFFRQKCILCTVCVPKSSHNKKKGNICEISTTPQERNSDSLLNKRHIVRLTLS